MKTALSLCCVMLAMLFHPTLSKHESQSAFRILDTPRTDIGYTYFGSMAITTAEDYNEFLAEISQQATWSNRQAFVDALAAAKIDFNEEALVLLRHDQPYAATRVSFDTPVLQGKTLLCEIRGQEHRGIGIGVSDSYAFALAVSKSIVDTVQLKTTGGLPAYRDLPILLFPTKYRRGLNFVRRDPPPRPKPENCPKLVLKCPTELIEKGTTVTLVVEGLTAKGDVSYAWHAYDGEMVEGQGTSSLKMRINHPNRFVTVTVDIGGGIDPACEHVFSCTFGTTLK